MTHNIFEIFNPGDRHWRENKDFEKVHVFTAKKGGRGPMQVDLDDKTIVLPGKDARDPDDDKPIRRGSKRAQQREDEPGDDGDATDAEPAAEGATKKSSSAAEPATDEAPAQPAKKRVAKPRSAKLKKN